MQQLSWADFDGSEGTVYQVDIGNGELALTLETAVEIPSAGRAEGSFRLEFRGPPDPLLPQAIYRFRHEDDSAEIFIVPVERNAKGALYEAIFY